MLLSSALIAGGALAVSTKLYQQNKRKREMPWTVAAEKMAKNKLLGSPSVVGFPLGKKNLLTDVRTKIAHGKATLSQFNEEQIRPLFPSVGFLGSDLRSQQFAEISHDSAPLISEAEQKANRHIAIASTCLGLAISGYLFFPPFQWLSVPIFIYLTRPIYQNAYKAVVKERKLTVDSVSIVKLAACFYEQYFMLCGLSTMTYGVRAKLLAKVKDDSRKNLIDIFKLQPRTVWAFLDGVEVEKPFEELEYGDVVVVNAGETISVDGIIMDGMASIDQHILTGESRPVDKGVGDEVFASTTILSGRIYTRVEKRGAETTVAKIADILNKTVDFKTNQQLWAEEISDKTIFPLLVLSALSYPFIGPMGAVTVLSSHFGYKLSTIAPVSILHFFGLASQHGILVKDGRTLEILNQVDTVVFDKTGTLTEEQPHVGGIHTCSHYTRQEILAYAAAAESKQSHPIAKAIQQAAETEGLHIPSIDEAEYKIGYGLTVSIDEQTVRVGSTRFMELQEISIPSTIRKVQEECHQQGHSLILVSINDLVVGSIELHATVRPEAKGIIEGLRQRGIKSIYIISGDHAAPTQNLAQKLGIDHYFAEVLPEDKASLIEELQKEGKFVCFVGDGINDSIALKTAQASISLSGASTIAIDTAEVILMNQSLSELCYLFDLARDLDANMKSTFKLIVAPCVVCVWGAFFLHFTILHAMILSQIAMYTSLANVMWPQIQHQRNQASKSARLKLPGTSLKQPISATLKE
ncbi:MAG: heavy metal translocating P-type ATPase [Ardenticatenaceae bacterium]